MKSSWIGIGFSHHRVPSLSNTATRSSTGTASAPSQVRATKSKIACFVAPSRQLASAVVLDELTISVSGTTDNDLRLAFANWTSPKRDEIDPTVHWNALDVDGQVVRDTWTSYQLLATPDGWRFLSYTNHF